MLTSESFQVRTRPIESRLKRIGAVLARNTCVCLGVMEPRHTSLEHRKQQAKVRLFRPHLEAYLNKFELAEQNEAVQIAGLCRLSPTRCN